MKTNIIAEILKGAAVVIWILGVGFFAFQFNTNLSYAITITLGAAVSGLFLFAFGEVIALLHKIAFNTDKNNR